MDSRRARAVAERDRLVREIIENTKIYQGGGSEVLLSSLEDRVKAAADTALVRLFPRFKEADSAAWESVIKRARDGAEHPFQPTGHTEATEKHPVCQQVLSTIGAGRTGTEVRKTLGSTPYGWPRDAVDAALIALHRSQHITATLNGTPVPLGQLDQNKIAKAEFRVEQATLSVGDRLILRKLFQSGGISCKSGEEGIRAGEFLPLFVALGKSAGGDPPLPGPPSVVEIEDIQRLVGTEQLVAIKNKAGDWESKIKSWTVSRDLITQRLPTWQTIERLAKHAATIAEAKPHLDQIDAIRSNRLLLDPSDPTNAIRVALASLLRSAVQKAHTAHNQAFESAMAALATNSVWAKVPSAEQENIKTAVGLRAPAKPEVTNDDALANHLERQPLANTQAEIDAIAGRVALAIERAAKFLEPKVQTVLLERSTLRDLEEVEAWIGRQRTRLVEAVGRGPVLVS